MNGENEIWVTMDDGLRILVSPEGQNQYRTAVITHYDREKIRLSSLAGFAPGQVIAVGLRSFEPRQQVFGVENLFKTKVIWSRQLGDDGGIYFESEARYWNALR